MMVALTVGFGLCVACMSVLIVCDYLLWQRVAKLEKNLLVTAQMVALREDKETTKAKVTMERATMRAAELAALRNRGVR